jgi:hypothetical protein
MAISALRESLGLDKDDIEMIVGKLPEETELTKGPEPIVRGLQDLLIDAGFKTVVEKVLD